MPYTTRFKFDLHMDAVNRDFDVILIKLSDYRKYKEMIRLLNQAAADQLPILAVQYTRDAQALLLTKKDALNVGKLRKMAETLQENVIIEKLDLNDPEMRKELSYYTIPDYRLFCLLANYIPEIENKEMEDSACKPEEDGGKTDQISNNMGHLYYCRAKWMSKGQIYTLRMHFDKYHSINPEVVTFTEVENGTYTLDQETFRMDRKTSGGDTTRTYIQKARYPDSRNIINFLDVASFGRFQHSKEGIIAAFLNDCSKYLKEYLEIEMEYDPSWQKLECGRWLDKEALKARIIETYRNIPVKVVDAIGNETSDQICRNIVDVLKEEFQIRARKVKNVNPQAYNIRLIHNADYYEGKKLKDPHQDRMEGVTVQHMTDERLLEEKELDCPLTRVLLELLIKEDTVNRKISLYDWPSLLLSQPITFITAKRESLKEAKEGTEEKTKKQPKKRDIKLNSITVHPDGSFDFSSKKISPMQRTVSALYQRIEDFQSRLGADERYYYRESEIEGYIQYGEDLFAIVDTTVHPIVNVAQLHENLKKEADGIETSREDLLKMFDEIITRDSKDLLNEMQMQQLLKCRQIIADHPEDTMKKKELYSLLPKRGKVFNIVNKKYEDDFNSLISAQPRASGMEELYKFKESVEYHYKDEMGAHQYAEYYVGPSAVSLKRSYSNGPVIRRIISMNPNPKLDVIQTILPLMDVEFVRNSQLTVIPFPFKYLRELSKTNEGCLF